MDTKKLEPNDKRVKYVTTQVRGKTYRYMLGEPNGRPVATMFLVHGFPDCSFGWRNQVPHFMSLGYRVVVPDMLGYAGTDCPADLNEFSAKSMSADVNELARQIVGNGQIILGGHDWGGFLVWRVALWHPELIKGVFSVCTPYTVPQKEYVPLEVLVSSGITPTFGYQIQFGGPEVETRIQGKEKIRQLLNALFEGTTEEHEGGMHIKDGVKFDKLASLRHSPRLSAGELEHYTQQYMLQRAPQLHGPLNWYRTRWLNFEEELPLVEGGAPRFEMPALFIAGAKDPALPPAMSLGMGAHFADLTRGEVNSGHWALSQAADEVNDAVARWAERVVKGGTVAKSSL